MTRDERIEQTSAELDAALASLRNAERLACEDELLVRGWRKICKAVYKVSKAREAMRGINIASAFWPEEYTHDA